MPSLIDFRRRIRSVKNTQQITKAMKMVSAAKLRRAQDRVIAARPYANLMREMLADLAAAAQSDARASESPWLVEREAKRIDLVLHHERQRSGGRVQFQPAQGLAAIFRRASGRADRADAGGPQRARLLPAASTQDPGRTHQRSEPRRAYEDAAHDRGRSHPALREGETDAVYLLNNEFKSVMAQRLSVMQLLPRRYWIPRSRSSSRWITSTSNRRSRCWTG